MAILKDTLINGACRVIGDAYFNSIIHGRSDYATRLHRRDDPSDYSVQTDWTGTYWRLRGYSGDSYHAGCLVAYADNSGTVGGLDVHSGRNNEANKIVRTDSNGYLLCGYINSSSGNENNNSSPDRVWGSNSSDSYLRTYRTSALSVGYATYCNSVYGRYTTNGGQQAPNYFGTNRVGFLMMNTTVNGNSNYKDWVIMDCYSGNDVGGGVAIGVDRQGLGAFIMRSEYGRTSWSESAELLGTHNYSSYSVALSGATMTGALTVPSISVTGAATFSLAINGSILGNAATASRLQTARTITIGSLSNTFDGSADISYSLASMGFTQANIKSTLGINNWALASSKPSYYLYEILLGSSSETNSSDVGRIFGYEYTANFGYNPCGNVIKFISGTSSNAVGGGSYWQISSAILYKHPVKLSFRVSALSGTTYIGFATGTPSGVNYFEDCFYINSSHVVYGRRSSTNVYNGGETVSGSDFLTLEIYDQEVRFYKNSYLLKRQFTPHGNLSAGLYFYAWFSQAGDWISNVEITPLPKLPELYYIELVSASSGSLALSTSLIPAYEYLETSSNVTLTANRDAQTGVMHYLLIANTSTSSSVTITFPKPCMAPSATVVIPANKYVEISYIYSEARYPIFTIGQVLTHYNA